MKDTVDLSALPSELQNLIHSVRRVTYVPDTEEATAGLLESRFCGQPALAKDEDHPTCGCCDNPMPLMLQLNEKDVPNGAVDFNGGVLQLFYCLACDDYEQFSSSHLVRIVQLTEDNAVLSTVEPEFNDHDFIEKRITGWTSTYDYPGYEERETLDIGIAKKHMEDMEDSGDVEWVKDGDKLGGWPYWIQAVEYPTCPHCNTQMTYLFQIESDVNVEIMFGDSGVGHITQCPNHKETLAFRWDCC